MNFLVWVFIAFCSSLILTLGTKSGAVFATTLPETPNADHFAADDVDKLEYEEQDPTAANLHFSGETALGFDFHQKPSSLKNHNQFNIPYFSLRLDTEPWESGSAHIAFGLEPQAVGKKSLTANELYAELEGELERIRPGCAGRSGSPPTRRSAPSSRRRSAAASCPRTSTHSSRAAATR